MKNFLAKNEGVWELEDGSVLYDGSGGTLIHSLTEITPPPPDCFHNISPSSGFATPRQVSLCRKVQGYLPPEYDLTWTASGSDALELAIWILARPGRAEQEQRMRFFVAEGSYHGATTLLQQLSTRATFPRTNIAGEIRREVIPSFHALAPAERILRLEDWLDSKGIGCSDIVIWETVPTTGAVFVPDFTGLSRMIRFCQERGSVVLLDEVASGAFRHGWFSSLSMGLKPDGLVLSKGLTCGAAACSALVIRDDFVEHLYFSKAPIPGFTVTLNDISASLIEQVIDRYEQLARAGWFERRAQAIQALLEEVGRLAPQYRYESTSTTIRISTHDRERFNRLVSVLSGANLFLYTSSAVIDEIRTYFALYCPAFDQPEPKLNLLDHRLRQVLLESLR